MFKKNLYVEQISKIDTNNTLCVDCGTVNPQFTSINNGVLICWECSITHDKLGYNVSYVRDINSEWDEYLFGYIRSGSNTRFKENLKDFGIEGMPIETKYKSKAVDYYRKTLKAKLFGQEAPNKPTNEEGKEVIPLSTDDFPEFLNYKIVADKSTISTEDGKKGTFFNRVSSSFQTFGGKVHSLGLVFGHKIQKMKLDEKIKTESQHAVTNLKKAGTFVKEKTSPVVDITKSKILSIKDKITKKKEEEQSASAHNQSQGQEAPDSSNTQNLENP